MYINSEVAKKFYKIGYAIFEQETREEVQGYSGIEDNEKYYAVVGEEQFKIVTKEVRKMIKKSSYEIKTTLKNVVSQIVSHYIACIENEVDETLSNANNIEESVQLFFIECGLEDLGEYDCEI